LREDYEDLQVCCCEIFSIFQAHLVGRDIAQLHLRSPDLVEVEMKLRALFSGIALLLLAVPRPAQAAPILGASLFSTGGAITAFYLGESAGYTHDLYVFAASDLTTPLPVTGVVGPGYVAPGVIFSTDGSSTPGDSLPIGVPVPAGDELVFGIYVRDTTFTFFTGPAGPGRNPDGVAHAVVDFAPPPFVDFDGAGGFPPVPIPPGLTLVGFEDLHAILEVPDFDFNDLGFAFTAVSPTGVPEPTALLLLGTGAAGLLARARRRKK
jgi:hypothetical protein